MPSLPSPETTMTLAGVGMVRFIPALLSFSFSQSSFCAKEFCVCGFSRHHHRSGSHSFVRDGLKTNSPNKPLSNSLSDQQLK